VGHGWPGESFAVNCVILWDACSMVWWLLAPGEAVKSPVLCVGDWWQLTFVSFSLSYYSLYVTPSLLWQWDLCPWYLAHSYKINELNLTGIILHYEIHWYPMQLRERIQAQCGITRKRLSPTGRWAVCMSRASLNSGAECLQGSGDNSPPPFL
jgi:hypothetical protein